MIKEIKKKVSQEKVRRSKRIKMHQKILKSIIKT